jgi:hypothetical protein
VKKSLLKQLASAHEERLAQKRQDAEAAPPDPYKLLVTAVQAWREAGWPDIAWNREPTAKERKAAKLPALLKIREALDSLGPKVREGLLSARADDDSGRNFALALLFRIKPEDLKNELPVPGRLEYDPIYTPIDQWISGKLLLEVRALLPKAGHEDSGAPGRIAPAPTPGSKARSKSTPGDRLRVDEDTRTVFLDGTPHNVSNAMAFRLIHELIRAHQNKETPLARSELARRARMRGEDPRPDRYFRNHLSPELFPIIVSEAGPNGGYSIKLPLD